MGKTKLILPMTLSSLSPSSPATPTVDSQNLSGPQAKAGITYKTPQEAGIAAIPKPKRIRKAMLSPKPRRYVISLEEAKRIERRFSLK